MELIRGIHNIKAGHKGCALTIGNFDGVHLGHQQVLAQLVAQAKRLGLPATVMMFEPQPLEVFQQQQAPARISRFRDKYQQLKALGVERLICLRFSRQFAEQDAHYFVQHLLVDLLGVKYLAVGDDFHFGKGRQGNFAMLQQAGREHGFTVTNSQSYCLAEKRVSSTAIREQLEQAHFANAQALLGRPFCFSGKVIHGQKLGRQLGFATANIKVARSVSPINGVFAVKVTTAEQQTCCGIANIGWRPTAKGKDLLLEAHLFNFNGELYGQRLHVEPLYKLRDEIKFASLAALKQQVELDIKRAKTFHGLAV